MRSTLGWVVVLGLSGAILVGCSGEGGSPAPVAASNLAPEIAGPDANGKPMRLSEFRGKVVAVDFWASW